MQSLRRLLKSMRSLSKASLGNDASSNPEEYPPLPPPPPEYISEHRLEYYDIMAKRKFMLPQGVTQDTPTYALYRLYQVFAMDLVIGYRNELEYFWNQETWAVCDIPDPKDSDPGRYAFLACVTYLLVYAFNERVKIGLARDTPAIYSPEEAERLRNLSDSEKTYERVPDWVKGVPGLPEPLYMRASDGTTLDSKDDPQAESHFKEKNIIMRHKHILFT